MKKRIRIRKKKMLVVTDAPPDVALNPQDSHYMQLLATVPDGILEKGKVYKNHFYHDDWCAVYTNGNCNCNVEMVIEDASTNKVVLKMTYKKTDK